MNIQEIRASSNPIAAILARARTKGVRLWSEGGKLHYEAPKGTLTQDDIEILRAYKGQIASVIEEASRAQIAEPTDEILPRRNCAPLAFSQLAYWNTFLLGGRRTVRGVSSATRLRGRLHLEAFRKSIAATVRRHEALRMRIVIRSGVPTQEVVSAGDFELETYDLTGLSARFRDAEIERLIEKHTFDRIDVSVDSLFGAWLLKISDTEHVLIVAMEHIISDGVSRNILLQDILLAYEQLLKDGSVSLPEISVQIADYAVWQKNTHSVWMENHGRYWSDRLSGCQRLRFPDDKDPATENLSGFGVVRVPIDANFAAELREWCKLNRTTLPMAIFTAYVAAVLRWCDVTDAVFLYQTDGRRSTKVQNTIGYFAFPLYLRIALCGENSFIDLLRRITDEYCNAYEHADFSYFEAQIPRPGFTHNTRFNWVSQGPSTNQFELEGAEGRITGSLIHFEKRVVEDWEMDAEPAFGLLEMDDGIDASLEFPLNRFSFATMEAFARHVQVFLNALLRRSEAQVTGISVRRISGFAETGS